MLLALLGQGCATTPRIDPAEQASICRQYAFEEFSEHAPDGLAAPAPDDEVAINRGHCLGNCPVYELTIKGDGRVFLVASSGPLVGVEDYRIDQAVVNRLFWEFDQLAFDTRPFVPTHEFLTCSQEIRLTHKKGPQRTQAVQTGVVLLPEDQARLSHLQQLVDTVGQAAEHLARCPPPRASGRD